MNSISFAPGYTIKVHSFAAIVLASLFLGLCSQLSLPLPFSPVPLSLQTLGLGLIAAVLGGRRAALAVGTYLAEGAMGLPVFALGKSGVATLLGTDAGYFIGFVISAYVMGRLLEKKRSFAVCLAIFNLGNFLIYLPGVSYLSTLIGWPMALSCGCLPFLIGDSLKALFCAWFVAKK